MKTAIITASLIACFALLAFSQPEPLYVVKSITYYWGKATVMLKSIETGAIKYVAPTNYDNIPHVGDTCNEQLRKKPYKK